MFKSTYYSTNYILLAVSQASPGQPIKYFDLSAATYDSTPGNLGGSQEGIAAQTVDTPETQDSGDTSPLPAPMAPQNTSEAPQSNNPPLPMSPY